MRPELISALPNESLNAVYTESDLFNVTVTVLIQDGEKTRKEMMMRFFPLGVRAVINSAATEREY